MKRQRETVLLLNCQDLFVFMDYYEAQDLKKLCENSWQLLTTSFKRNKPIQKIWSIAHLILKKSPLLIALTEVAGKESLENFNKYFLEDRYQVFHAPSNSDRGIDTGFLVIKTFARHCELKNFGHNKLGQGRKFSRGLLRLKVKLANQNIYIFLCHLKSKLDSDKKDYEGRAQRQAEAQFIGHILNKPRYQNSPTVLLGDLNGIIYKAETEPELACFEQVGFIDLLESLDAPLEHRASYIYFDKAKNQIPMQLDYALGNEVFTQMVVNAYISDFEGHPDPFWPRSIHERNMNASDHFPYFFEVKSCR